MLSVSGILCRFRGFGLCLSESCREIQAKGANQQVYRVLIKFLLHSILPMPLQDIELGGSGKDPVKALSVIPLKKTQVASTVQHEQPVVGDGHVGRTPAERRDKPVHRRGKSALQLQGPSHSAALFAAQFSVSQVWVQPNHWCPS